MNLPHAAVVIAILGATALALTACATGAGPFPPEVLEARNVSITNTRWAGHEALKVTLTPQEQAAQLAGAGANRPTYAILDETFTNGVIEVDVAATRNGLGGANARGFAGIAFHLSGDDENFEAVYLRMDNGTLNSPRPDSPRDARAVQYVAHPDFHFDVSREQSPGLFERAAPVRLGAWHRFRLEIDGAVMVASVDGTVVLQVDNLKRAGQAGRIALWVGDGSDAYFRNLDVRPAE